MEKISYGIILFNKSNDILMIRRQHSYGYFEYITKRYLKYSQSEIQGIVNEMTIFEKERLIRKNNTPESIKTAIICSTTNWKTPEWGFPKGQPKCHESPLCCALREFNEETGIDTDNIVLTHEKVTESIKANNGKYYKVIYYIANVKDNDISLEEFQRLEVSKIQWMSPQLALKCVRYYFQSKRNIIKSFMEKPH